VAELVLEEDYFLVEILEKALETYGRERKRNR
jgi:hypothetical protein